MRLQCRVTPAHSELLQHLESIEQEYRGKRLVAMAAMYLGMLSSGVESVVKMAPPPVGVLEEVAVSETTEVEARPVANWIRGASV